MKLEHRLHDIGDQLEAMALQARNEHFHEGVGASGVGTTFQLSVPELLATFLSSGRYDLGKGSLVVPDNVRARIEDSPVSGRTRFVIWQGQPQFDGGRFVNLIADLVQMTPSIPWIDLRNDLSGGVIRIDPWKDIEFELAY